MSESVVSFVESDVSEQCFGSCCETVYMLTEHIHQFSWQNGDKIIKNRNLLIRGQPSQFINSQVFCRFGIHLALKYWYVNKLCTVYERQQLIQVCCNWIFFLGQKWTW